MSASGRRDQISRLFQILFALRSGHPNASELAAHCEVSSRTIYRDLAALELAGVPLRYRPETRGYEIAPAFSMPVPNLSRAEAASLVAASRLCGEGGAFLGRENRSAMGKILSALAPADRRAVEALGHLLVTAEDREDRRPPAEQAGVSSALFEGLSTGRRVRAWFEGGAEDAPGRPVREETLGLYRLVRMRREWHLLGHRTEEGAETIAMGLRSIRRAEITELPFEMPGEEVVDRLLGMAGLGHPVPPSGEFVRLRALARLARRLRGSVWHPARGPAGGREGWQELTMVVEQVDPFLRTLLGLGDGVEMLSPLRLVARLRELAEAEGRYEVASRIQGAGR